MIGAVAFHDRTEAFGAEVPVARLCREQVRVDEHVVDAADLESPLLPPARVGSSALHPPVSQRTNGPLDSIETKVSQLRGEAKVPSAPYQHLRDGSSHPYGDDTVSAVRHVSDVYAPESLASTSLVEMVSTSQVGPAPSVTEDHCEGEAQTSPLVPSCSNDDSSVDEDFLAQEEFDPTSWAWEGVDYSSDDLSLVGAEIYFDAGRRGSHSDSVQDEDEFSNDSSTTVEETSSDLESDSGEEEDTDNPEDTAEPSSFAGEGTSSDAYAQSKLEDEESQPPASPTTHLSIGTPPSMASSNSSRGAPSFPPTAGTSSDESQLARDSRSSAPTFAPTSADHIGEEATVKTLYSRAGRPMRQCRLRSPAGSHADHNGAMSETPEATPAPVSKETMASADRIRKRRGGNAKAASSANTNSDEEGDTEALVREPRSHSTPRLVAKIPLRPRSARLASREVAEVAGSSTSLRGTSGSERPQRMKPPVLEVVLEDKDDETSTDSSSAATTRRTTRASGCSPSGSSTDATSEVSGDAGGPLKEAQPRWLAFKAPPSRASARLAQHTILQVAGSSSSRETSGQCKPPVPEHSPLQEASKVDEIKKALTEGSLATSTRRSMRVRSSTPSGSTTVYNSAASKEPEVAKVPKRKENKVPKKIGGQGKGKGSRYEHYDSFVTRTLGPEDVAATRQKLEACTVDRSTIVGWEEGDIVVHPKHVYRQPCEDGESPCGWPGCSTLLKGMSKKDRHNHFDEHARAAGGREDPQAEDMVSCLWRDCIHGPMQRQHVRRHITFSHQMSSTRLVCPWPGCDWTGRLQNCTFTRHLTDNHYMSKECRPFMLESGSDTFIRGDAPENPEQR